MSRSIRLPAAVFCLAAFLAACDRPATSPQPQPSASEAAPAAFAYEEADIVSLQARMKSGELDSHALTQAYPSGIALGVARVGFLHRVWIELDHRVERRAGVVDRGDAVEVGLGERVAVEFA